MFTRIIIIALMMVAVWQPVRATAQTKLDEMSLDRWEKLREVERYQLNIAEKYYKEKKYDVAMSEYENTCLCMKEVMPRRLSSSSGASV